MRATQGNPFVGHVSEILEPCTADSRILQGGGDLRTCLGVVTEAEPCGITLSHPEAYGLTVNLWFELHDAAVDLFVDAITNDADTFVGLLLQELQLDVGVKDGTSGDLHVVVRQLGDETPHRFVSQPA